MEYISEELKGLIEENSVFHNQNMTTAFVEPLAKDGHNERLVAINSRVLFDLLLFYSIGLHKNTLPLLAS